MAEYDPHDVVSFLQAVTLEAPTLPERGWLQETTEGHRIYKLWEGQYWEFWYGRMRIDWVIATEVYYWLGEWYIQAESITTFGEAPREQWPEIMADPVAFMTEVIL